MEDKLNIVIEMIDNGYLFRLSHDGDLVGDVIYFKTVEELLASLSSIIKKDIDNRKLRW